MIVEYPEQHEGTVVCTVTSHQRVLGFNLFADCCLSKVDNVCIEHPRAGIDLYSGVLIAGSGFTEAVLLLVHIICVTTTAPQPF